jgi:thiamine pyrophosphokinase
VRAIVVAGGSCDPSDADLLTDADLVVAADGGARWLVTLPRMPDLLVGDLDSTPPVLVAELEAAGVPIERHPVDKDASDLELALAAAAKRGATEITVLGALHGERLDHELANLLALADPTWPAQEIAVGLVRGGTTVAALHGPGERELAGQPGDVVSLLPIGGDADGVTTRDLRYPLDGERLAFGLARGISNVVDGPRPSVRLGSGTLLIIEISGAST